MAAFEGATNSLQKYTSKRWATNFAERGWLPVKVSFPIMILCMFVTSPLLAQGIPAQLRNKTIHISATFSTPMMGRSGPTVGSQISTGIIYISTLGRIFVRDSHRTKGGGSSAAEKAPGETRWRFVGGKLVANVSAISGAVLLEISFDGSFQSCTFSGIVGHEGGKSFKWVGVNGTKHESTGSSTISGASCSITEGNGL
ncbi:MAG: hypothetical protein E7813_21510 [Bradyrhizobium sp.]|uniref:hypothetical protein n=1 Tax=Bradyrhizobium sp. TaxID=376 RepID=UPI00122A02C8|nr:hypothetical protein [Bradyrhizobium sp.]THD61690.1 MAG: hypothetical protein E7813_21510 [Bradyrhizobium sp.]